MVALRDVLQVLGVDPLDANHFASSIARNKPRFEHLRQQLGHRQRIVAALTGKRHTFVELYGRGAILEASHGCRRNVNIDGLSALDLRTHKSDGTPWDFNKASDRQRARQLIIDLEPEWGHRVTTLYFILYPECQLELSKARSGSGGSQAS